MPSSTCPLRLPALLALFLGTLPLGRSLAQDLDEPFVTGAAAQAWQTWQQAMQALIDRDAERAEALFGELIEMDASPLRIAMLAERSVRQNIKAGGVLLLEEDYANDALEANGREVAERLLVGREQMNQADDGWYFASIGRFAVANANFQALLASDPDPVALLEFADQKPRRHQILVQLSDHPVLGQTVTRVSQLLLRGEQIIKADPIRIKQHIQRLGGPPRAFENAVERLKESGEYAVPFLLQSLQDHEHKQLTQPILRMLPLLGRSALNPLVQAVQMRDATVREYVIRALGRIGYAQAVPYLLKAQQAEDTPPEIQAAVQAALSDLQSHGVFVPSGMTAAEAFFRLAEVYYDNEPSVAPDPRLDAANVWYWRDGLLENVLVPTPIFNDAMAMRCCEEALILNVNLRPALALWIAANFRRQAELPEGTEDDTRPENYPTAAYFARSAGSEYCQLALARAIDDRDPVVALGAIEALRATAGAASLISVERGRQPLAEALTFPDRMVRIRAGLALAAARPKQMFPNVQNLAPVLNEALRLYAGARYALVIDPDANQANEMMATLRASGYEAIADAALYTGLDRARKQLPGVDVIVLASDIQDPDLAQAIRQIRAESQFALTPIMVVAKPGTRDPAEDAARTQEGVGLLAPGVDRDTLQSAIRTAAQAAGATEITADSGRALALEAAQVLRLLAISNTTVLDLSRTEPALLFAFETDDPELKRAVAAVLAFLHSIDAQSALAFVALDASADKELRISMFEALAESGKHHGNLLETDLVQSLIETVQSAEDMDIRTAASQALGALNLPGNPASEIIRSQHRG